MTQTKSAHLPTWGLVATIRAPTRDILNFAAHHIDLGAHRLHIYLDAPDDQAFAALKAHPKCRVTLTGDAYWQAFGRRPKKHQPRQSANATRALNRNPQVDWLAHIDVDEFLWPLTPLPEQLAALPADTISARTRPVEALAPDPDAPGTTANWFKACSADRPTRIVQTGKVYPTFGQYLNGGFLSHVEGKIFTRTGLDGLSLRIHNAFLDGEQAPDCVELPQTRLCHLHAATLDHWLAAYRFRLSRGSYRASLKPAPSPDGGGLTMHQLFNMLDSDGGEAALVDFFTQVCTATPDLRARLKKHGLLHLIPLDLDQKRSLHFPQHG